MTDRQPSQDDSLNRQKRLLRRGTTLLQQGNAAKAATLLARAYQIAPDDVDIALNLSSAYILTRQFDRAIPILEKLTEQLPDNEMIWTNLGAAYLGNPVLARDAEQNRAIEAFEKALSLNPNAPHVAYNLGLVHRDRREFEKAVHWFEKAIETNPRDVDAHALLKVMRRALQEEE
ncbi:MAG: hypothetical protein Kow0080_28590 [Candidatus Promineifilaceae bacterium]